MIRINNWLSLPAGEVTYTYSASPGPGGQNVNKVATKATLWFDVRNSPSLTPFQRGRIVSRLASRIGGDGLLQVSSSRHRTQVGNRRDALQKFVEMLEEALRPERVRKKTRPTRGSQVRRAQEKRHRGAIKAARRGAVSSDE